MAAGAGLGFSLLSRQAAAADSLVVIELSLLGGCGYFLMHNSQFLGFITLICFIAINT